MSYFYNPNEIVYIYSFLFVIINSGVKELTNQYISFVSTFRSYKFFSKSNNVY